MKQLLLLLLAFNVICYKLPAIAQQSSIAVNDQPIDSLVIQKTKESGMVGAAAVIIVDNKLVWKKAYGLADREQNRPFTTSTVMNIASVSKTVTGACMMKAAEQGKLDLDADINQHLPFKIVNPYFPKISSRLDS